MTKVAIIGCGAIANAAHGPSYQKNSKAQIAYMVDIIPERAQALKEKFGTPETVVLTDYHDMLADQSVKAVSVCVPNYLHLPITLDCLKACKNVLCEKPASVTYDKVEQMAQAAKASGKILNIGVVNRFNGAVNEIRRRIQAGELGEVYHVYCSFRAYRSIPGLGGPFTTKALAGGGVLIDWGVHYLDLINYILDAKQVKTVSGECYAKLGNPMREYVYESMWAGPPDYEGTCDVEEFVTGLIRTDKASINLNGAWAQNIFDDKATFIEFLGTKGGIKLTYCGGYELYGVKNGKLCTETPEYPKNDMFFDELDAFIDAAESNAKIQSNIENILITARMMQGLYDSSAQHREIIYG